ncbi:hypothetical protein GDO78_010135 [Eleutherodactylus coqui]|uniref:Uncharacterized protein n=1 Tax=Eleutherodactylus coqui TaxID=57060 RepID=A0A8J6FD57_ELECQ|nr:hypothetical protein GDO78_010135 [Eleutherodactylus coqui]
MVCVSCGCERGRLEDSEENHCQGSPRRDHSGKRTLQKAEEALRKLMWCVCNGACKIRDLRRRSLSCARKTLKHLHKVHRVIDKKITSKRGEEEEGS